MENVIGLSVFLLSAPPSLSPSASPPPPLFPLATRIFQRDAEMREMARTYTDARALRARTYVYDICGSSRSLSRLHTVCTVGLERA